MNYIESQFGNPHGFIGHLVGLIMTYENRERNQWALSLLDIQSTDHILEIGFGPGWAIQQASKQAVNGLVAGVDHSFTMVQQASLRNRIKVKTGQVFLRKGSATQIPFNDGMFHKVYAVNSFHEWDEQTRSLKEANRVLVPEGLLLVLEHPHNVMSEKDMHALQGDLTGKLSKAGFHNIHCLFSLFQDRPAIAVKGIKR